MLLALAACCPPPAALRTHVSCREHQDDIASYDITQSKPLGLVFEERADSYTGIVISESVSGGNADVCRSESNPRDDEAT